LRGEGRGAIFGVTKTVEDQEMKMRPAFPAGIFCAVSLLWILLIVPPAVHSAETGFVFGLATYPLRDTPQFSAIAAVRLHVGTRLVVLERKDGWIRVRAGEETGWMPDSVVRDKAPPAVQLGPLQGRVKEAEARLGKLVRENDDLNGRNDSLAERVTLLEEELEDSRGLASGARSSRRLQGMALGGGLVLFGWVTGYALAARSGQKRAKGKLIID